MKPSVGHTKLSVTCLSALSCPHCQEIVQVLEDLIDPIIMEDPQARQQGLKMYKLGENPPGAISLSSSL